MLPGNTPKLTPLPTRICPPPATNGACMSVTHSCSTWPPPPPWKRHRYDVLVGGVVVVCYLVVLTVLGISLLTLSRTHTHTQHTLSLSTNVQLYGDSPMSALPAVLECASVCQSLGKLFVGLALLLVLFPPRGVPLTRSTHSLFLLVPRFDNIEFQNRHFAVQNSNSTRSAVGWVAAIGSGTSQHLGPLQFQNTRRRTHVPGQMFVGHGQSWQYSIGRWCHSWGCQEKIESTNVYRSGTGVDRCLGRLPRDVLHQRHVGSHVFDGQIVRQLWKSPRIQKSSGGQVC